MDDVVQRLARELAAAISAGVAEDPRVAVCRDKARAAGYEMRISLEALIGFAARGEGVSADRGVPDAAPAWSSTALTATDRRFLRALRISAEDRPVDAG